MFDGKVIIIGPGVKRFYLVLNVIYVRKATSQNHKQTPSRDALVYDPSKGIINRLISVDDEPFDITNKSNPSIGVHLLFISEHYEGKYLISLNMYSIYL